MAGYHNDQFFRLSSPTTGETSTFTNIGNNGAGWALRGADNPNFIYPDRTVRTQDHEGSKATSLKRGYIRSLATYTGGGSELDIRKCQFQFNPATLTQSVESAQSTLNFAQMDPGQYAVPRSTSVNFTFDLLFDRSMELNNSQGVDAPVDGVNPWQLGDPSQVGVLRDLAAFYGVIGQSIDPSQAAYMEKALIESIRAEAAGVTSETNIEDTDKAISNVPAFIQANAANSAFLLPTPVRVMFSTLYVVEGFVTNTTVTFTKFNTAMVPMQCALSVTMEAKYIGFATKNTFLQWSLERQKDLVIANEKAESARVSSLYSSFSLMAAMVEVGAAYYKLSDQDNGTWPLENLVDSDVGADYLEVFAQLPMAKNRAEEDDPVFVLFEDSPDSLNVKLSSQFWLYGPFDTGISSSMTQAELSRKVKDEGYPRVFEGMLSPGSGHRTTATSASSWRGMVKRASSNEERGANTRNEGYYRISDEYDSTKWYVMAVSADMQVSSTEGTFQGLGSRYVAVPPDSGSLPLLVGVALKWPTAPTATEGSAAGSTVPPDNAATAAPSPGTTSTVGTVGKVKVS